MEFRYLGRSGLLDQRDRVRQLDHARLAGRGGQRPARACAPRSTPGSRPSTPRTSTPTAAAESVLGRALAGRAPRGAGDLHQGVLADRARATTTAGCRASTSCESIDASLRRLRHRLRRPLPGAPLRLRDAARGDDEAFADVVRAGKALYIGVSEWTRRADPRRRRARRASCKIPFVSNQPQYSMLWRVIEAEVVPACARSWAWRRSCGRRSPRACSPASTCPASRRPRVARHRREGRRRLHQRLARRRRARRGCSSCSPIAEEAGLTHGAARGRVGAAERQRRRGDHRRLAGPSRWPRTSRPPAYGSTRTPWPPSTRRWRAS